MRQRRRQGPRIRAFAACATDGRQGKPGICEEDRILDWVWLTDLDWMVHANNARVSERARATCKGSVCVCEGVCV